MHAVQLNGIIRSMAQVDIIKTDRDGLSATYPWLWLVLAGAGVGLFVWLVGSLLNYFVTDPLFCRSLSTAGFCTRSGAIAFNVATVLGVIVGIFALFRSAVSRPLLVTVAAAVSLWTANQWVNGLSWWESLLWLVLLYTISYLIYAWITRILRAWVAVLLLVMVVALIYFVSRS